MNKTEQRNFLVIMAHKKVHGNNIPSHFFEDGGFYLLSCYLHDEHYATLGRAVKNHFIEGEEKFYMGPRELKSA